MQHDNLFRNSGKLDEKSSSKLATRCVLENNLIPESHKVNPLLTEIARSRWLDTSLVLIYAFMDQDEIRDP